MKKIQQGFTLIELMIVVAIIGILAAIAIPAYQDYTIRAQVTEGLNLAGAVKAGVAEAFANTGEWPADMIAAGGDSTGLLPSGKYVDNIDVLNGTITITFGNDANARQFRNASPAALAGKSVASTSPSITTFPASFSAWRK